MTREEAIKWLTTFKGRYGLAELENAVEKAIKALEQNHKYRKEAKRWKNKALEQQKTGHWIMTNDYFTGAYGNIDYVECSCCHEYSLEEGDYCPSCGAKMAESEEVNV